MHNQPNEEHSLLIITEQEADERLDKILAHRYKEEYSRTYFQGLIERGCILVNGSPIKKRTKLAIGDEVEIDFMVSPEIDIRPEAIPLNILYEDEALLIIDKPPGLVVHPAVGNWSGTLVNALMHYCQNHCHHAWEAGTLRPGIVHRLDKDTSGLIMVAKTPLIQKKLTDLFATRSIHKEYLAVCLGNPGSAEIKTLIGRHPIHRQKMAVVEAGGKEALTICQMISFNGALSLVSILLRTGRTHQIRVHMKHQGTPILGDSLYGNATANGKYKTQRQLLHAWRLGFTHPLSDKEMLFEAPVPLDMQAYVNLG